VGCSIHSYAEVKHLQSGKWELVVEEIFPLDDHQKEWHKKNYTNHPFNWRSYKLFAFLADVRNSSCCLPIAPCRGLPEDWWVDESDIEQDCCFYSDPNQEVRNILEECHSHSWLLLRELLDFDYEQKFCNRDTHLIIENGNQTWSEEKSMTYREHLGERFFEVLEILRSLGNPDYIRLVFWFDS